MALSRASNDTEPGATRWRGDQQLRHYNRKPDAGSRRGSRIDVAIDRLAEDAHRFVAESRGKWS
jgi:hypothetical protein